MVTVLRLLAEGGQPIHDVPGFTVRAAAVHPSPARLSRTVRTDRHDHQIRPAGRRNRFFGKDFTPSVSRTTTAPPSGTGAGQALITSARPACPTTSHPSSSRPPATSHQPPATSHQPPGTRHQAPGTTHQAPPTSHQAPPTSHHPPGTTHRAPGTGHRAPGTGIVRSRTDQLRYGPTHRSAGRPRSPASGRPSAEVPPAPPSREPWPVLGEAHAAGTVQDDGDVERCLDWCRPGRLPQDGTRADHADRHPDNDDCDY